MSKAGRKWAANRIARKKAPTTAPAEAPAPQGWTVEFLNETVKGEFVAWPAKLRASLTRVVERVKSGGPMCLTAEHAKQIRGDLWELRASAEGNEGRALYVTVTGRRVVIVLCGIKKRQTTPSRWIDTAQERAKTIPPAAKPGDKK